MSKTAAARATPVRDWRTLDLADPGRSLIEASAGTGKTWTIAVLYLRLILERELSPRQIIVTTFTDAAAQELRERLRGKLLWAERIADAAATQPLTADIDETWLRARWIDAAAQHTRDLHRLRLAIAELDVAAISTLHGLCRRILADHPFACGAPFVSGELVSGDALRAEVVADIWRSLQQGDDSEEWVREVRLFGDTLTRAKLDGALRKILSPGITIEAAVAPDLGVLGGDWPQKLRALAERPELLAANSKLRRGWRSVADWIESGEPCPPSALLDELDAVCKDKSPLLVAARGDKEANAAVAFTRDVIVPLVRECGETLPRIAMRALDMQARSLIAQRLAQRNEIRFDDLLTRVHDALCNGDDAVADALAQTWPVALVDEFQDTDSIQYGILDRIYRDTAGEPRGRLVMIGDPKQAIYRFRGGDIHTYGAAANAAAEEDRLTLDTNHRSSQAYVAAINELFACGGSALSAREAEPGGTDEDDGPAIHFHEVLASARRDDEPYTVNGEPVAKPLFMHFRDNCPAAAGARRDLALGACANQITDMLATGTHAINGVSLQPSDIAVLLPTTASINQLRDLLRARGVPCVTSGRSSVFDTDLARELQVILHAVVHNTHLGATRAAVATRLWGATFSELQRYGDDVGAWKDIVEILRQWQRHWHERGIQVVVDALIERMAPRYLATLGGERAITDLRHLGELLQAQDEASAGVEELLAWFAEQREANSAADEEAAEASQLRIESDSARVRLMTLHASKGLEFPIVFLPLMWNHIERKDAAPYIVHEGGRRVARFADDAQAAELADLQDERFRVLYVALTRAIHACHVFALPTQRVKSAKAKSPDTGTARTALDVVLERMQPRPDAREFEKRAAHIDWIAAPSWRLEDADTIRYRATGDDASAARVARVPIAIPIGPIEARHSFTTLTQRHTARAIDPDAAAGDEQNVDTLDIAASAEEPLRTPDRGVDDDAPDPALEPLARVRGADFGNAIHAMFEHRVIGTPLSAQHELIAAKLDGEGVRRKDVEQSQLVDALAERLQGALDAPLGLQHAPQLRLADLAASDLRAEMAFHFPLRRASMPALREACARHGEPDLVPDDLRTLSGLMNGKIDLIFQHDGRCHVLDYKGNDLGIQIADYEGERLQQAMQHAHYRFQALLYSVALDRYLQQRLGARYARGQHLGECIYLFVRAAGVREGAGIWRHRFDDALLDAVGAVFDTGIAQGEAA